MTAPTAPGPGCRRHNLRRARERRGWSQNDLAGKLYILGLDLGVSESDLGVDQRRISEWENGKAQPGSIYTALICRVLELRPAQLDLPEIPSFMLPASSAFTPRVDADESSAQPRPTDDDSVTLTVNRRDFLEALGASAVVGLPGTYTLSRDAECAALAETLGHAIAAAWTLFHSADTDHMVAVGRSQLYLLNRHHSVLSRNVLPTLYSAAYRLLGAAYHRSGRYHEALLAHDKAYMTALEGGDEWNMAESRGWQAYGMQALGRHGDALAVTLAALRLIAEQPGMDSTRLRARLHASAAMTAASIGDEAQVGPMLAASEALLDQLPPLHEEFDQVAWLEAAGVCALRLGHLDVAVDRLRNALDRTPREWTARCVFTVLALATASARTGDRAAAVAVAKGALPQLRAAQSRELTGQFAEVLRTDLAAGCPSDRECHALVDEVEAIAADA
jgi:transcriptional regulator with XRE-family HTH domain/tetratricopeptide (TPR) repeat protein